LAVYLFWLVAGRLFSDFIKFTPEFMNQIREEFNRMHINLYFDCLIKLPQLMRDTLMDYGLCFFGHITRDAIDLRIKNHMLKLQEDTVHTILVQTIYTEMYGYLPSKAYIFCLIKKHMIS
jgi:hypothetical protein